MRGVLAALLALLGLDGSVEVSTFGLGKLGAFVVIKQVLCIVRLARLRRITLVLVVEHEEELAGRGDDLRVCVHHAALPDRVHCLLVVPDAPLVQLDHHVKGAFCGVLVRVLQQRQDEILELFVDAVVLGLLVDFFHIGDDAAVQELPQLLVLASEEFEEHWEHNSCRHNVFAAHDFKASDQGHAHLWVQYSIVLLQQIDNLRRQKVGHIGPVNT